MTSSKIKLLNNRGIPVIFVVGGNNSSGKTILTKKLIQNLDFYQSVNLGIVSKMIRFFRLDIKSSELENFDSNEASKIFKDLTDFIIGCYFRTGVNIVIEGVQIDTQLLLGNNAVIGGVILEVNPDQAIKRGDKPETHFSRSVQRLKQVDYVPNLKFKSIDNSGHIKNTFDQIVLHLNTLLDAKLRFT